MLTVLIVLIIIAAVLMILVVLAQNSKGGVGSAFGSSGASQMIGVKKSADILEKLTWGFIVGIVALSIAINVFLKTDADQINTRGGQNTQQNSQ